MTSTPPPGVPGPSGGWKLNAPVSTGPTASPGPTATPTAPTPAPPSKGPDRVTQRLYQAAGVLSLVLIAVVGYAWLVESDPTNPVAEAAAATVEYSGARADLRAVYSVADSPLTFTATGESAYNTRTGMSEATMTVAEGPVQYRSEAVVDGTLMYMRITGPGGPQLPPGKSWTAFDFLLGGTADTASVGTGNPGQQLEMLAVSGSEVEELGSEEIRGVESTHYRTDVDAGEIARTLTAEGKTADAKIYRAVAKAQPGTVPFDAWIGDGLVQRLRMEMPIPARQSMTMTMTMEFHDFGAEPEISTPPSSTVVNVTALSRARLGLLDGRVWWDEMAAAQGPELTAAEYRRRANRTCRTGEAEVAKLTPIMESVAAELREAPKPQSKAEAEALLRTYFGKLDAPFTQPLLALGRDYLNGLARLTPPASLTQLHRRALRLSATGLELIEAMMTAGILGERNLYKKLEVLSERADDRSDMILRQLGLPDCTSKEDESGSETTEATPA